ncbi:hypothetical protein [Chloroflexus sp.]|uniref:hypothetical protein n=1 Tax=Chloroflexus sp. TaxID=1904827 RepID=UPI002614CAD4|nr:hypothetical protein [uncultured Chloroflexus sp.]
MELYQRQQFDLLLMMAVERFAERMIERCAGPEAALARLRTDPQGEGIWLDRFVDALFQDFLLDNPAGACFVLQALADRAVSAPPAGTINAMLQTMARRAFADLLVIRAEEALEQMIGYH